MPFYSLSLLHKWRKDAFVLSHYLDNMSLTLKAGWIRKGQQFSESIHSWKEKTIIIICWLAKHTWESMFITSTKKLPCLQIIIRIIISFYSKSCQLIYLPYTPHAFIRHNCMSSTMFLSSLSLHVSADVCGWEFHVYELQVVAWPTCSVFVVFCISEVCFFLSFP